MSATTLQLNKAISACARGERWREALQLLRAEAPQHGRPRRDVISYNSTANACVKGEQWQVALLLFQELQESGMEGTVISYNIAMKAYEQASAWLQCLDLLQQMELQHLEWDAIGCNTAISACAENSQWQRAVAMALATADLVGMNAAIDACSSASEWQQSLRLLSILPRCALRRDVISFTAACSACEKGAQWPMVLLLLEQMEKEQVQGNLLTYNSCISALSKGGEWKAASRLFDHLGSSSCDRSVASHGSLLAPPAATSPAATGVPPSAWRRAQQVMESMRRSELRGNVVIYNSAMSLSATPWDVALCLLEDLEASNLQGTTSSFGALIQALKIGSPGHWQRVLDLMPGPKLCNSIIYNSAISSCAQGQQGSIAWKLFHDMQGLSLQCDAITFTGVMAGRHWSAALQLLQRSRSAAVKSDLKLWSAVLNACELDSQWSQAIFALASVNRGGAIEADETAYSLVISACKGAIARVSSADR